jgi:hypothetical protein
MTTVTIKTSTPSETVEGILFYILIALAIFVVFIWIILAILKYKLNRRNRATAVHPNNATSLDDTTIFLHEMTTQFPKKTFRESASNAESCSICLEPFAAEAEVRELACTHVFHTNCIDVWFV